MPSRQAKSGALLAGEEELEQGADQPEASGVWVEGSAASVRGLDQVDASLRVEATHPSGSRAKATRATSGSRSHGLRSTLHGGSRCTDYVARANKGAIDRSERSRGALGSA